MLESASGPVDLSFDTRDKCNLVVRQTVGRHRMRPVVTEVDTGQCLHGPLPCCPFASIDKCAWNGQSECSPCLED